MRIQHCKAESCFISGEATEVFLAESIGAVLAEYRDQLLEDPDMEYGVSVSKPLSFWKLCACERSDQSKAKWPQTKCGNYDKIPIIHCVNRSHKPGDVDQFFSSYN